MILSNTAVRSTNTVWMFFLLDQQSVEGVLQCKWRQVFLFLFLNPCCFSENSCSYQSCSFSKIIHMQTLQMTELINKLLQLIS